MAVIKIKQCSNPHWWYKDKVGNTYEVEDSNVFEKSSTQWGLRGKVTNAILLKEDVELLNYESKIG